MNKVVIVTGGSQGIGEGCVRVFVANGAKVVACALGKHDGDELVDELNQKGKLLKEQIFFSTHKMFRTPEII